MCEVKRKETKLDWVVLLKLFLTSVLYCKNISKLPNSTGAASISLQRHIFSPVHFTEAKKPTVGIFMATFTIVAPKSKIIHLKKAKPGIFLTPFEIFLPTFINIKIWSSVKPARVRRQKKRERILRREWSLVVEK